jgi:hypothetical protein
MIASELARLNGWLAEIEAAHRHCEVDRVWVVPQWPPSAVAGGVRRRVVSDFEPSVARNERRADETAQKRSRFVIVTRRHREL